MSMDKTREISDMHKEFLLIVGDKLKNMRAAKELGYEQLAFQAGLHSATYWKMEKGEANFQIRSLLLVLDFHQKSLKDFINEL